MTNTHDLAWREQPFLFAQGRRGLNLSRIHLLWSVEDFTTVRTTGPLHINRHTSMTDLDFCVLANGGHMTTTHVALRSSRHRDSSPLKEITTTTFRTATLR